MFVHASAIHRRSAGLLSVGTMVAAAAIAVSVAPAAATSRAAAKPAISASPNVVPPGFDTGGQTTNPLTRLFAGVQLATLPSKMFSPLSVAAPDDVVGQHGPDAPLGLVAWRGVTSDGVAPPDPQIAVGGGFVVQVVNGEIAVFNRTGTAIDVVSLDALFGGGTASVTTTEPKIVFDPGAGVWYLTVAESPGTTGNTVDLAVSHTADPTGLWDVYQVSTQPSNRFAQQPRLGFSSDKVLIDFTSIDTTACSTCTNHDDYMVVIEKSDLTSLASAPQAIAIDMTEGTNHRFSVVPAIPLPAAEVPDAYAVYRGRDALGHYDSTLVIVGLPSTDDVAFKETGPSVMGTSNPPAAAQRGVTPNSIDAGDDRMQSVSLIEASATPSDFSAVLWTAGGTACKPSGGFLKRACARIDKVDVDSSGNATVSADWNMAQPGNDILYPAVVGDAAQTHVWVAYTQTGELSFPTSELRLVAVTASGQPIQPQASATQSETVTYGAGTDAYTTDRETQNPTLTSFGEYSGIAVDSSESSGATVWATTENAAPATGGSWQTSIVEATELAPTVTQVAPGSGFAGDTVDLTGESFSESTSVRFGGIPSPQVTFLGSDHLQAVVPAQNPTTVNVFATTLKGTNAPLPGPPLPAAGPPDRFQYKSYLWSSGSDPAGNVVALDPITDTRRFSVETGTGPTAGIAISRDQSTVYAVSPGTKALVWIDAAKGTLDGTIHLGVDPTEIAVSADGNYAFVTDPGAFAGKGGVIPVDLTTASGIPHALPPVAVAAPGGVATALNGEVYVTSQKPGAVVILSFVKCPVVQRWCVTNQLPVSAGTPGPITAGPDLIWVGVTGLPGTPPGVVYSIDPTSPVLSPPLALDQAPTAMAASPNGTFAFAIAAKAGMVVPVLAGSPNKLLSPYALPDGPFGGGAVSFDSTTLYVAGGSSGAINAAAVPGPYIGPLTAGPASSAELATDLPLSTSCGSGNWADPASSVSVNENPAHVGSDVTVTASFLFCPPQTGASVSGVPTVAVHPPAICVSTNPVTVTKPYTLTQPTATLTAPGMFSFAFQFTAKCAGGWTATPSLGSPAGFVPSSGPAFKATTVLVSH